jgi:hypothetical protein
MGKISLAFILLLAACGDDDRSMTWAEAEEVWANSWCDFAARCSPPVYEAYGGDAGCVDFVVEINCDFDCSEEYPRDREPLVEQCRLEMEALDCSARVAPGACYSAYFRP